MESTEHEHITRGIFNLLSEKKLGEPFGDDSTAHHSVLQQLKDQPAVQALGAPVPLHIVPAYFYQVKV